LVSIRAGTHRGYPVTVCLNASRPTRSTATPIECIQATPTHLASTLNQSRDHRLPDTRVRCGLRGRADAVRPGVAVAGEDGVGVEGGQRGEGGKGLLAVLGERAAEQRGAGAAGELVEGDQGVAGEGDGGARE